MEKEFNLSEKIRVDIIREHNQEFIEIRDIKEFIKRLKEATFEWMSPTDEQHFNKIIDKLAGEKFA